MPAVDTAAVIVCVAITRTSRPVLEILGLYWASRVRHVTFIFNCSLHLRSTIVQY